MTVQRRRLAVLAILAAAGERGVRRDQIIGYLWPENTEDSARHSLDQLLYGLRRSVHDSVIVGTDPLTLDESVVESDVRRFSALIESDELTQALSEYKGCFLEGFHLGSAAEFDHWLDAEQREWASKAAKVCEKIATAAQKTNSSDALIESRRRLTELEPLSARRTVDLMHALAEVGDTSGALRQAQDFETRVRKELDIPADASVTAYAAELRALRAHVRHPPLLTTADDVPPIVEGLQESAFTGEAPSPFGHRSTRRYAVIAVGIAVVLLSALSIREIAAKRSSSFASADSRHPSIAILAAENASSDSAVEYYSYGLTDALIDRVTSSGSMRVIQGPSAYVVRRSRVDTRAVADSLGVTQVLASNIMVVGDQLRVSVRLINGSDGAIRWSQTYSSTWTDRFALQNQLELEVPVAIAKHVPGAVLTASVSKGPRTHRAYELYLRGRHQWNGPAPQPLSVMRQAIEFFNGALKEDSLYADAYAGLAASYAVLGTGNISDFDPRIAADSAKIAALKAIELNDSLPEAHVALAMVDMLYDYDWPGAAKALARAREINPYYSRAPLWPSVYFEWKGDFAEAVREAEKTVSTDPLAPNAVVEYARALFFAGRYEEAKVQVEKARARDSTAERLNLTSGEIHLKQRNFSLALREFERFSRLTHRSSRALSFLANCRATMGDRAHAVALLAELRSRQTQGKATSFDMSIAHAGLAGDDSAFVWLNRAYEDKSIRPIIMDPTFARLQSDPRFDLLMRRMKLRG